MNYTEDDLTPKPTPRKRFTDRNRFCCDGGCLADQGRGSYPRFVDTIPVDPPCSCVDFCEFPQQCLLTARASRSLDESFGTRRFDPVEWPREFSVWPWLGVAVALVFIVASVMLAFVR